MRKIKLFIGTSGWTYSDWKGVFYPEDLPQKQWLPYYAKHFSVVEMNASFYRFFKKENYQKWYETVPRGFNFIVKAPRIITHQKYLLNCETLIK